MQCVLKMYSIYLKFIHFENVWEDTGGVIHVWNTRCNIAKFYNLIQQQTVFPQSQKNPLTVSGIETFYFIADSQGGSHNIISRNEANQTAQTDFNAIHVRFYPPYLSDLNTDAFHNLHSRFWQIVFFVGTKAECFHGHSLCKSINTQTQDSPISLLFSSGEGVLCSVLFP